ncbi:MAG: zinc ABC transporter substrate-binding protein [Rhizobiaceae bacterium]|nr:zinc ABC transporter substrate-binding protein [Rhizobiaceae bacterium]
MRLIKSSLLASTLLCSSAIAAHAEINVVASIKPVHSLVAAVMEGVGSPELIVEGAGSPHTYALKPSQAQNLENADVVFWIGHDLEAFLEKPLEAIATKATTVELLDAHDLVKLKFREGGAFDEHDHDDHAEAGHDDHGHEEHAEHKHDDDHKHEEHAEHKDDDHKHEEHAEHKHDDDHKHEEHAEGGHDDHAHGEFDPHVWLDPVNAKALVHEIEEVLVKADPDNAAKYEANANKVSNKLDGLVAEISGQLEPVKGKGFVVFHDAYQHFEKRFGLSAIGSVTVSPEVLPGAERISELREKVTDLKASCVFSEPQFEPKLVTTITEGTQAKSGVLDPLGAGIEDGPELYFTLIRNMAASFETCLAEAS